MREAVAHCGIGLLPAAETIQPVGHVGQVVVADKWRREIAVAGQRHVGFGRCRKGLSSCVPFSSTSFHRWLPSPPILISVACLPMMRVKLSQSLPKLVE